MQVADMSKQTNFEQLDRAVTDMLANRDLVPADASVADLLLIARDLSVMPRPDFKARLRSALERTTSMSTKTVQLREGFRTVTPYIFLPETEELIAFVQDVFGGVETGRSAHESGAIHAEVRIGDSMLMIGGGPSYKGPRKPVILRSWWRIAMKSISERSMQAPYPRLKSPKTTANALAVFATGLTTSGLSRPRSGQLTRRGWSTA
jgi:hypothetical protein